MTTLRWFSTSERFWAKVDFGDECWNWTGGRFENDYGAFQLDGKAVRAHRVAWELINGPIPEGLIVCHHCDNPGCQRPNHLFLGTHADNAQDRERKGRRTNIYGLAHRNGVKTHCYNGHPLSGDNLQTWGGKRQCKQCKKDRRREREIVR